jgi:hypothetical protein
VNRGCGVCVGGGGGLPVSGGRAVMSTDWAHKQSDVRTQALESA